jgi:class 3 adenylate cyclase
VVPAVARAVRRLGLYRREITSLVEERRGRLADFTGDNFPAEFPTPALKRGSSR